MHRSIEMPGCLSYVVAKDPQHDDALWITEVWDSEASQRASLALPAVRAAIARGKREGRPSSAARTQATRAPGFGCLPYIQPPLPTPDAVPIGLLPLGDAICRFNPIYGQGMSVAAEEALVLILLLEAHAAEPDPLQRISVPFREGCAEIVASPWQLAAIPHFAGAFAGFARGRDTGLARLELAWSAP